MYSGYNGIFLVGERLGGGHIKVVNDDHHGYLADTDCGCCKADNRRSPTFFANAEKKREKLHWKKGWKQWNKCVIEHKSCVSKRLYPAHFWMLHFLSAKKTSLCVPESRCLPVSVTAVPPNTGPCSGRNPVNLGSWSDGGEVLPHRSYIYTYMNKDHSKNSMIGLKTKLHKCSQCYHKREAVNLWGSFDWVAALGFDPLVDLQGDVEVLFWCVFPNLAY